MNIAEYKAAVIELFRSGRATPEQWEEMASCAAWCSENVYEQGEGYEIHAIDTAIIGPLMECGQCGAIYRGSAPCPSCGSAHWKPYMPPGKHKE